MKKPTELVLAAALLYAAVAAAGDKPVHAPLLRKSRPAEQPAPQPAARPASADGRRFGTRSCRFPVLSVLTTGSGKKEKQLGIISYRPLTFTREKTDKPLRIMISDDTPGGSSETIRNSVWQAAITAAMLRNDTMHGVTISVGFSGNVDGPSAGAVTCLAILTAMDGRELPGDFAMTGTIMPDGTIGVVGGVRHKIRAAAKSGAKRIFIPASLRMEHENGRIVDLKRLAEELKVTLYRVENIEEAYALLHRIPYRKTEYMNVEVREMTRLPREVEDMLRQVIDELSRNVAEKVKKNRAFADWVIFDDYMLSPDRAATFLNEGKYLPAALQLFHTWQAWIAVENALPVLRKFLKESPALSQVKYLKEYHLRRRLTSFVDLLNKHVSALQQEQEQKRLEYLKRHYGKNPDELFGYFPFVKGQTEITAQLEPVNNESVLVSRAAVLLSKLPDKKILDRASEKKLREYWDSERKLLLLFHLVYQDDSVQSEFLGRLGATMPKLRANRHAGEVERLFYVAAFSTVEVAKKHLDDHGELAAKRGIDFNAYLREEPLYMRTRAVRNHAYECHSLLSSRLRNQLYDPAYHLQASLKAQVESLVLSSAVMVKYGPDSDASDFLPLLTRNARNAAIRNISECVKAKIPCLQPIYDFEVAESSRDSRDPYVPLTAYWRAALYAKALLMSFKPETDNL